MNPVYEALAAAKQRHEVIDLTDTNFHRNGFRYPADRLAAAAGEYFARASYDPDPKGAVAARRAVAGYYDDRGIPTDPASVILTCSTSESYSLLFGLLTRPGDRVLLPVPGYPLFDQLAEFHHITPEYYDLWNGRSYTIGDHSFAPLEHEIAQAARRTASPHAGRGRYAAIVLISPNNPTGRVFDAGEVARLVAFAEQHAVPIIVDEVFAEYLWTTDLPQLPRTSQPLFILNGVSKMFAAPDLKLGWIRVQDRDGNLLDRLETLNDSFLSSGGLPQYLLPLLMEQRDAFLDDLRAELAARRECMLTELATIDGLRVFAAEGGIHVIAQVDPGGAAGAAADPASPAAAAVAGPGWQEAGPAAAVAGGSGAAAAGSGATAADDPPGPVIDDEQLVIALARDYGVFCHPGYLYGIDNRTCLVLSYLVTQPQIREGCRRLRAGIVAARRW